MRKTLLIAFTTLIAQSAISQIIKVNPYLQDATPHSIVIMWETDTNEESTVEWGLTDALGEEISGTAFFSEGNARIHQVELSGLTKFTKYFYRVKTGAAVSEIYNFKTPPFASDRKAFRMIAMSDMQQDSEIPGKFSEVINEGIIKFLSDENGGELIDNLVLVMIPGDLVQDGNNFNSWANTFFKPSENLFSQVPVYPVPGNHENNSQYFFKYFKLPENGSPGFEEHWWHKDYGNVRIIGLDSNSPFSNQQQLDWLETLLEETSQADSIKFVFAQLHHPYKSELWTPGELDYTGEVIRLLENFTTETGKPSIHFFGHTHAYSRGQSRDHKHLWINVATAGGAIDNWGEFPNYDYDEFAVSEDEYGFVSVEVTDDDDPKVVVKRITRGDQDVIKNNLITDSITIRLNSNVINKPVPVYPVDIELAPECVKLKAGTFSAPVSGTLHGQSHWQVSTSSDFSILAGESWKNFENWYFEVNTQAGDDLEDEEIIGLLPNTAYFWRVRYRDRELNWSQWSDVSGFETTASISSPNLLQNPGAEDSITFWTVTEGIVETLAGGVCDGTNPHSGSLYFIVGGLCEHSEIAVCHQDVDVTAYEDSISTGNYLADFGGYLSNYQGTDIPEIKLIFLNANGAETGVSNTLTGLNANWTLVEEKVVIPTMTAKIRVELKGTRTSGTDNDSYFDDLFLRLGAKNVDCSGISSVYNQPYTNIPELKVEPNPAKNEARIFFSKPVFANSQLLITDLTGRIINLPVTKKSAEFRLDTSELSPGSYFIVLKDSGKIIARSRFIKI